MAVDAAVDDEAGRDDRGVAPCLGEDLRMQRDLERARHLEHVDMIEVTRFCLPHEGDAGLLDHVAVPAGLHEGHPLRFREARMVGRRILRNRRWRLGWLGNFGFGSFDLGVLQQLIHGFPQLRTRIRAHGTTNSRILRCVCHRPFSFIRTLTVGFGVAPNLLTLPLSNTLWEGARGLRPFGPYRRWGLSPRPENIGRPE